MARLIVATIMTAAFIATPVHAQSGQQGQPIPPFISVTIVVVPDSIAGSESAVVVWGPRDNGDDHLIILPADLATAEELRNAAAALLALVRNGESFEAGTWLRAGSASDPIPADDRTFAWVPQVIDELKTATKRPIHGLGNAAAAYVTLQVNGGPDE